MKNLPSDLKLLSEIYERYYEDFKNFSKEEPTRDCKVYVPINIRDVSINLNTDEYMMYSQKLFTPLDVKNGQI
jgi:hypothetical protein